MIGVDLKILQGNTLPLCSRSDFRAPSLLATVQGESSPASSHISHFRREGEKSTLGVLLRATADVCDLEMSSTPSGASVCPRYSSLGLLTESHSWT